MKKLVIIRHAKSDWGNPYLDDYKRPLSERGLRDLPIMAQRLKKLGIIPDAVLSSDAERAKSTALIIAENLKFPKNDIDIKPNLYLASSHRILSEIMDVSDSKGLLFVIGHNPGLNDLIFELGGKIDNLTTSGQFGFIFEADSWKQIKAKNASFWFFDCPKLI